MDKIFQITDDVMTMYLFSFSIQTSMCCRVDMVDEFRLDTKH